MTDQEMFETCVERCKNNSWEHVVSAEIVERINDTAKLHGEIRKLWGALMFFGILVALLAALGCAHPEVNKCTYICPKGKSPPIGCYCLEDEIDKEARSLAP